MEKYSLEDRSFCNRRIESNSFFFFFCSSTVNLVINLFFELCSFLYKNCCLSFYSFLTLLLRIYAFNNIEIVLLIKIQCSSERALLSALSPGETSQTMRFQMLFQETSAFCYLAARRVDPNLAL